MLKEQNFQLGVGFEEGYGIADLDKCSYYWFTMMKEAGLNYANPFGTLWFLEKLFEDAR